MDQTLHQRADDAIAKLKSLNHEVSTAIAGPDGDLIFFIDCKFKLSMREVVDLGEGRLTFPDLEAKRKKDVAKGC